MRVKLLPKLVTILLVASATILFFVSLPGVTMGQEPEPTPAPLLEGAPAGGSGGESAGGRSTEGKNTGPTGSGIYLIRLKDAPLASYRGGMAGLDATSPRVTGASKLNIQSAESVAYRDYLAQQRAQLKQAMERTLGHAVTIIHEYDVTVNGMAVKLTAAEATRVSKLRGVAAVMPDAWRQPTTTVSPEFIGATGIWSGTTTGGLPGTQGEGIIVGVIDSGIWPEHPSFADTGYPAPPAGWGGTCNTPADSTTPLTCTNKLIGAQSFITGYITAVGGTYDGLFNSARDDDGHGTHTASTAAGNRAISATLLGVARGDVSGIAPRAHVAAYKALGPQGGVTSDLVAAIDKAVADGVDVINYSIGGGASDPWGDFDSLAFLGARDAGVFVATSAGNAGPGVDTVGSPGNAPWVTTVGASTSNRHYISDITLTGSVSSPITLFGASVTGGVTDLRLIDAAGIPDSQNDDSGLCLNPYTATVFLATDVVLCERGINDRVEKGDNVAAGGAGGVIVFNPALQGLATDSYIIPAVHVENDAGALIKDYLNFNPVVTVTFTAGTEVFSPDPRVIPDLMAAFSSRGPNGPVLDIIKPDVTAPGVQILAGASPEHVNAGAQGELFQAIQGTSMSSPHVAGAGALLKALHPTWTPAEIQSALMSTALNATLVKEDGITRADPFDLGGGRIDLTVASLAGLVLDETTANYLIADPFFGGDPTIINQASLGDSACVVACSWVRRLTSSASGSVDWSTSATVPTGMAVTVSPSSFTLAPGATQVVTITADVGTLTIGDWVFAQVNFTPNTTTTVEAHFPIAVRPALSSLPDLVEINALDKTGTYTVTGLQAVAITDLTTNVYGLVEAQLNHESLSLDSDNSDPFDDLADGVFYITKTVVAGDRRLVAEITASEAPDLDLYVGLDDGDGLPEGDEIVCTSTSGSADEYCSVSAPAAGTYWILVQNWAASAAQPDDLTLATAVVRDVNNGNLTLNGPDSLAGGTPFALGLNWNTARMLPESRWYGVFDLGTDTGNAGNLGTVDVNLIGPNGLFLPLINK